MTPKKTTIAVDIDDTLIPYVPTFFKFYNEAFKTKFEEKDLLNFNFETLLKCTVEQSQKLIMQFHETQVFKKMQIDPSAIHTLVQLSSTNDLWALTARPSHLWEYTNSWITKNLPEFKGVKFSYNGTFKEPVAKESKMQLCKSLGAQILIDDSESHSIECAKNGIRVFLIDKPWNRKIENDNIIRVKNWKEINERILPKILNK